jgi:predicted transcriptional regulator YdeE
MLWNELDDTGRAVVLEELEALALAGLTRRAELKQGTGTGIPHMWHHRTWMARAHESPTRAFILSVRGSLPPAVR